MQNKVINKKYPPTTILSLNDRVTLSNDIIIIAINNDSNPTINSVSFAKSFLFIKSILIIFILVKNLGECDVYFERLRLLLPLNPRPPIPIKNPKSYQPPLLFIA